MLRTEVEVILLHDFQKRGKFGNIITVARGYAKNFLIPNKLALYANAINKKKFDELKTKALEESSRLKVIALEIAEKIMNIPVSIIRQSGQDKNSKIFGTVNSRDISDELLTQGIVVERSKIFIPEAINRLGIYKIKINLHPDVICEKEIHVINAMGEFNNKIINDEDEDDDRQQALTDSFAEEDL